MVEEAVAAAGSQPPAEETARVPSALGIASLAGLGTSEGEIGTSEMYPYKPVWMARKQTQ